jgi:glucose/arabinose dehydrogenase
VRAGCAIGLAAAWVLVVPAGGTPTPPKKPTTVAVSLVDFRIRPARMAVAPGPLRLVVANHGRVDHDLVVTGRGRTRVLHPGQRQTIVLRFPKSGLYRLYCSLPGHVRLGMVTTLRVGKVREPTKPPPAPKPAPPPAAGPVQLTPVASGLGPVTLVTAPPGDPRTLAIVRQDGVVSLLRDGRVEPQPFLDLREFVTAAGENGLLSLAFSPDYATSGLLYVDYNDAGGNLRIVEYRRSAGNPDLADVSTARQVLEIPKPTADHNGGMLQFGPDGYLYVAVGDGGANPPGIPVGAFGQTVDDLLGSILRIDPRNGSPYAIPPGNPFAGTPGARPEIVAYGLRNPWRFWIDDATGSMLIGDVGEGAREEIDRLPLDHLGLDFGWPCLEGTATPDVPRPASCATSTLTPPLYEYAHVGDRCSITGGVVVRDPRLAALAGLYVWADLCEGELFTTDPSASKPAGTSLHLAVQEPTSFGVDGTGRVYVATHGGDVFALDPA